MRGLAGVFLLMISMLALAACQAPMPNIPTPQITPHPTLAATLPPAPDASFALHFEYGVCYTHVLDTAAGTYQRQVPGQTTLEAPLVIGEADLATIYAKLREIDFLSYPAIFEVPVPTDGIVIEVMPATSYRLTVRSGDTRHTVEWIDDNPYSPDPAALRLRELFWLIRRVMVLGPEVRALPTPNLACV